MYRIVCLNTGEALWFQCKTPLMAMQSLLYYLNLKKKDVDAKINKTPSGLHLYTDYNGKTWTVKNEWRY